ncbi:unnamed protein product [Trichogramma brassicae]|uniref:Uncharacterized protein n=1 Tax=Trichogramma brassicae TaxID=86971 RepID=A0A6H5IHG0_9HYME|nr:unnamed protein product [Trichogramma brassicae]
MTNGKANGNHGGGGGGVKNSFASCYMELCRQQRVRPLPMICVTLPHSLDFSTDRNDKRTQQVSASQDPGLGLDRVQGPSGGQGAPHRHALRRRVAHAQHGPVRAQLHGPHEPRARGHQHTRGLSGRAVRRPRQHQVPEDAVARALPHRRRGLRAALSLPRRGAQSAHPQHSALRADLGLGAPPRLGSVQAEAGPVSRRLDAVAQVPRAQARQHARTEAADSQRQHEARQRGGDRHDRGHPRQSVVQSAGSAAVRPERVAEPRRLRPARAQPLPRRRRLPTECRLARGDPERDRATSRAQRGPGRRQRGQRVQMAAAAPAEERRATDQSEQAGPVGGQSANDEGGGPWGRCRGLGEQAQPDEAAQRHAEAGQAAATADRLQKAAAGTGAQMLSRLRTRPAVPMLERRPRQPVRPLDRQLMPVKVSAPMDCWTECFDCIALFFFLCSPAEPTKMSLHLDLQSQIQTVSPQSARDNDRSNNNMQLVPLKSCSIAVQTCSSSEEDESTTTTTTSSSPRLTSSTKSPSQDSQRIQEVIRRLLETEEQRDQLQEDSRRDRLALAEERARREFAESKLRAAKCSVAELEEELRQRELQSRGYLLISQKSMEEICASFTKLLDMLGDATTAASAKSSENSIARLDQVALPGSVELEDEDVASLQDVRGHQATLRLHHTQDQVGESQARLLHTRRQLRRLRRRPGRRQRGPDRQIRPFRGQHQHRRCHRAAERAAATNRAADR